jgi:hypothetical protein
MNRWMDGCVVVVVIIVVVVVMKKRNAMVKLYLARVDVWLCYIYLASHYSQYLSFWVFVIYKK